MVELPHKIYTPQRPPELVQRPRLIEALQKIAQRKLIALVAPAGYGKTSLLIDLAHMTTLPLCWYTLDAYDADPWSFLLYLTAAVEHRFPGSTTRTTQLLRRDGQQFSAVVETLIHELSAIAGDFVICLDDWHLVDKVTAISELVATILSRCPNSHIILAARSHPSLPNQMLLAARRQFVSINETQLRFSAEELARVIACEGICNFTPEDTEWLVTQSDGWLTGILLALQTTNGDIAAIVANRTVMSRPAHHFLAEQVLDRQPPAIQQFLIESSMLEELTVERCNTLLGRNDSWSMLEYVLSQRLFVTEIAPGVLRQHPLFRELLQQRLQLSQPEHFCALSQRMAADFSRQGQWPGLTLPIAVESSIALGQGRADHQPSLRANYLGADQVWIDDKSIPLGTGRARELLAYLITHPQGASRRDLYRAIWCTDEPPEDPNALNRVIYRLRAALPPGAIITINRDSYCLDRAVLRVEIDAESFERLLDHSTAEQNQMQTILKALDLYRGVFLPSVQTSWSCNVRQRLELRYRNALRQAAEQNEIHGSFAKALDLFRQLASRDTTNIAAHAGIMRCHIALQWPALAIEQYRTLRHTLDSELGIGLDPSSEPERMYQMLLAN